MAIEYLKKGLDEKQRIEDNDKVKKIVEETLSKIESEGDKYVRELSQKFDNYSPDSFRSVSYTHLTLPTILLV